MDLKKIGVLITFIYFGSIGFLQAGNFINTSDGHGADATLYNDEKSGPERSAGARDDIEIRNHSARTRIGYLKFDLGDNKKEAKDAILGLKARLTDGLKSDTMSFSIFGLTIDSLDNWSESEICYKNAPGFEEAPNGDYKINDKLKKLTSIKVYKDSSGVFLYSQFGSTLDEFINSDGNGILTFAIIQTNQNDGGLYLFDSKESSINNAPRLILQSDQGFPPNFRPSITLNRPYNNGYYDIGKRLETNIDVNDQDGKISQISWFLDDSMIVKKETKPWEISIKLDRFSVGSQHNIFAIAEDNEGARDTTSVINFNVVEKKYKGDLYISPAGSDSNSGIKDEPLATIQAAQEKASPGDTIYIRGGKYEIKESDISKVESGLFACVSFLDKSGEPDKRIKYWAYPGEEPVFDFSAVKPEDKRVVGIWVEGDYIHIKGLEMTGVQVTITTDTESYCIYSHGNHNIFENLSLHDNMGTGLRHYDGGYNLFLNCDAYRNHDDVSEDQLGGNTDGFGCHPEQGGKGNVFRGCRAWFNSDDGFDCIRSDESITFDSCWAFYNGYSPSFDNLANGNGFKAGGYAYDPASEIPDSIPTHTIKYCLAVRNKNNGFYSNHHLGGNKWFNNSAYKNDVNFNMVNRKSRNSDNINVAGYGHILKNNLAYLPRGENTAYLDTAQCIVSHNSFYSSVEVTDNDFVSLNEELLTASRKSDGNLPDVDFMKLASSSDLINKGVEIGFPYQGSAPDLGAFEYNQSNAIYNNTQNIEKFKINRIYPNPFNPTTTVEYSLPHKGKVHLSLINIRGRILNSNNYIKSAGLHSHIVDGTKLSSGIYFIRIKSQQATKVRKVTLIK